MIRPLVILFALNALACSGAVLADETRQADAVPSSNGGTQAPDVAEPDATPDAASDAAPSVDAAPTLDAAPVDWCEPVTEAGAACAIEPMSTCEREWNVHPAAARACMGAASLVPTTCLYVTSSNWCGVVVYCCGTDQ